MVLGETGVKVLKASASEGKKWGANASAKDHGKLKRKALNTYVKY